jgi:hypothetical protein
MGGDVRPPTRASVVQILLFGDGFGSNPLVAPVVGLVMKDATSLEKDDWQIMLVTLMKDSTTFVSRFVQVAGVNPQK